MAMREIERERLDKTHGTHLYFSLCLGWVLAKAREGGREGAIGLHILYYNILYYTIFSLLLLRKRDFLHRQCYQSLSLRGSKANGKRWGSMFMVIEIVRVGANCGDFVFQRLSWGVW